MFNDGIVLTTLEKLSQYPSLLQKEIDLSKYPFVENETCGGEVSIDDLYSLNEAESNYMKLKPYIENPDISFESQIVPIISSYGNVFVCLGVGHENKGFVYLLDFDFGCFLLDRTLDDFLSKLIDA